MQLFEKTLGEWLEYWAERTPDKEFIVYSDRNLRFTYRQFNKRVNELAKGLLSIGVTTGSHVGIWATNVPDWLTFLFASAKIGAVLVTVTTNYKQHELEYLTDNADLHTLCISSGTFDSDYIDMTYTMLPELRTSQRGNLRSERFPCIKNVIYIGQEKHRGMYNTAELLLLGQTQSDERLEACRSRFNCYDVVNMQYTSGTTGFPKGVMLTHHTITNNGYCIGQCMKFTENDLVCLPVPLFHCFGCALGVSACVNHGACMVILEAYNPLHVLAAVDSERCTALYGVPTMFLAELEHKMFKRFDVSSLRTGIMAGSVCPEPLMRRVVEDMYMKDITICYGLTEGSPVMTQSDPAAPLHLRCETVGCAMPGIEVRIGDPETCEELPRGEVGEILCRGYNVMKGYYNMPEEPARTISPDGWLHSGDLGTMDEDGYVRVTGRIKDMIIRGGENVYPREIEEFLMGMPGVLDIQVVAVPSRKYGEEVGAFIIARPDVPVAPEDVRAFCRGKIAWYKIPRYIAVVDGFPLTASGKIQKFKLREMAAERWPEAMAEPDSKTAK